MSKYIRDGKKILQITVEDDVVKHHLMVFASINQAKLHNRTKLHGQATLEPIKAKKDCTTEQFAHVHK